VLWLLLALAACDHAHAAHVRPTRPPAASPAGLRTLYRPGKMDRIAHFVSKYWDGGHGDPLDVYNLTFSHASATGCRFSAFHAYRRAGDLVLHSIRARARMHLLAGGADIVGFGRYHGDWWAVTEDCSG
jgi:hypothetical protein